MLCHTICGRIRKMEKIMDACKRGKGLNGGQESCLENWCLSGPVNESSSMTLIELLDVSKEKY